MAAANRVRLGGSAPYKVLCGGEALPNDLAQDLTRRSAEVWNLYGPTETTIWSTVQRLDHERAVTIGRPIANTQIYLLNDHLQAVPCGVPGQLYIGGAGLALAYLNQPALTAERFVPDPFGTDGAGSIKPAISRATGRTEKSSISVVWTSRSRYGAPH